MRRAQKCGGGFHALAGEELAGGDAEDGFHEAFQFANGEA